MIGMGLTITVVFHWIILLVLLLAITVLFVEVVGAALLQTVVGLFAAVANHPTETIALEFV